MSKLKNKVALVTGGSRGIGAAIAKKLAHEGALVVITYHAAAAKAAEVVRDIEAAGGRAMAVQADNADPLAVQEAVKKIAAQHGQLDILVNNAGIAFYDAFTNFTIADFDRITAVNIRAVFAASQAVVSCFKNGGRIITIGSCQAERMPVPGGALYAMSKSALIGLTKGMARDLGPQGITVNLVHPGPIDTDMNPAAGPHADGQRALMALSQFGSAADVAALVAHLAGPEGGYITGAGFTIDGGTNC
ncbi:3-oxoacyl-ACP reductase family protein [Niabella beijingensis]|uniref:3-oxoacyl-ACP reductase family protein n=1 Tax=Niabella beijingensis TaxID=2872700 RepID=UPI001CC076C8|nr:3-oxoacyl-ACP reductase family protein [Niabella beijingensis]MBZ4190863.1 3-oxoacyl-ACP reductase FabG [Niabella beijingensis]